MVLVPVPIPPVFQLCKYFFISDSELRIQIRDAITLFFLWLLTSSANLHELYVPTDTIRWPKKTVIFIIQFAAPLPYMSLAICVTDSGLTRFTLWRLRFELLSITILRHAFCHLVLGSLLLRVLLIHTKLLFHNKWPSSMPPCQMRLKGLYAKFLSFKCWSGSNSNFDSFTWTSKRMMCQRGNNFIACWT